MKCLSFRNLIIFHTFSSSLIIHEDKTKQNHYRGERGEGGCFSGVKVSDMHIAFVKTK